MNRFFISFFIASSLLSCSKMDEKPLQGNDTLLVKPMNVDAVQQIQQPRDTVSGLLVDQARFRTPEHEALLNRFEAWQVVSIFHDFKSIRKPGIKQIQIDSFDKAKKITTDELKAILEEGDKLGWSKK